MWCSLREPHPHYASGEGSSMQHVVIQELPCKRAPIASSDEEFIMTLLSNSKQGHILKGHWGLSHGENRGRGVISSGMNCFHAPKGMKCE